MAASRSRKIFVNLPVKDLKRSIEFFTKLGFSFNPRFTDETATCMILSDDGYVMLLTEAKFNSFSKKPMADARTTTGGMFALTAESRAEVEELVHKAIAAGGSQAAEPIDMPGYMYGWSFYDLDGHHWELVWMNPSALPPHNP